MFVFAFVVVVVFVVLLLLLLFLLLLFLSTKFVINSCSLNVTIRLLSLLFIG